MIDLRNYTYTNWEQLVIDKYGKNRLEKVINNGMLSFYISIHDNFLPTHNDQCMINDNEFFVKTALDYIFQNDEELQSEHDVNIENLTSAYEIVNSFYHKGDILTQSEAITKAKLFYEQIRRTDEWLGDYWFGLSDNFDLNIFTDDTFTGGEQHLTLYSIIDGEPNYDDFINIF